MNQLEVEPEESVKKIMIVGSGSGHLTAEVIEKLKASGQGLDTISAADNIQALPAVEGPEGEARMVAMDEAHEMQYGKKKITFYPVDQLKALRKRRASNKQARKTKQQQRKKK